MNKIVLISCVSKKLTIKTKAENLYISPFFIKALKYAKLLNSKQIFILSAKYGLINLDEEIEPYNQTLNKMKSNERKIWANNILEKLKKLTDIKNDEYIFLAGKKYREYLIPDLTHYQIPMEHLGIGKQLQWLGDK
jgi:hypothetical protein